MISFTTLIAETIIVGCFAWAWIIILLYHTGVINASLWKEFVRLATDQPAAVGLFSLVLIYPLGTLMSILSYRASWLLADQINRGVLKGVGAKSFDEIGARDFNDVYVYVLEHGSPTLVQELDAAHVPAMRISRGLVPNLLALSIVTFLLFSRGVGEWLSFACASLALVGAALGLWVFWITAEDWKGEYFAAYQMLRRRSRTTNTGRHEPGRRPRNA